MKRNYNGSQAKTKIKRTRRRHPRRRSLTADLGLDILCIPATRSFVFFNSCRRTQARERMKLLLLVSCRRCSEVRCRLAIVSRLLAIYVSFDEARMRFQERDRNIYINTTFSPQQTTSTTIADDETSGREKFSFFGRSSPGR